MKKIFLTLVVIFIIAGLGYSQSVKSNSLNEKKVKSKITEQIESKKIWNAICPVMGEPVDPEVKTVEYKGKVIGFCCKSCIKKFLKEPEKYLKNLSDDGKKLIKN
ncbi:MAG: YHS domain-containing protein [Ignavibacteria bacterium]|nr:YHS domain-containing protein [Ignavibacteria bacterium]